MKRIKLLVSLAVIAAAAAICAAVVFAAGGDTDGPTSSLNHIEEIKANVGDNPFFTILEIVPEAPYDGSIGYYIDGYEPCRTKAINILKDNPLYTPDDRRAAIQTYFAGIESKGLISDGDNTPLKRRSIYREYFPWDESIPSGTDYITFSDSARYDTHVISNKMTEVTDSSGKFQKRDEYGKQENGGSEQIIEKLVYVEDISSDAAANPGSWYYAPSFKDIKLVDILDDDGNVKADYWGKPFYKLNDAGHYEYLSTFKSENNEIPLNTNLYIVETYGAPWEAPSESARYRAVSSGFTAISGGWFAVTETSYVYVGEGGDYNISAEGGSSKLKYNKIYYDLGIENNNWFLKYVFDYTDAEIASGNTLNLHLMSVTASEAELDMFSNASLVVLSADVTGEQKEELTKRISTNRNPLIVDMSVSGLKTKFCSEKSASFVNDSLMGFLPSENPLVSKDFNEVLTTTDFDEVKAVKDDIDYEVWLREAQGSGVALANPRVSLASCIRYVINYYNKLAEKGKHSLRVLDIEPLPVEDVMNGSQSLTKAQVLAWLPSTSDISADSIEITHTSTAEFIGKIENINEKYDLIYIGASLAGFNTKGSNITDYNDDNMDGLIYSNIGDVYNCSKGTYVMSGMLDRDYSNETFPVSYGKWKHTGFLKWEYVYDYYYLYNKLNADNNTNAGKMRLSGNDITQKKADELEAFAKNGHPIVVADELLGERVIGSVSISLTLNSDKNVLTVNYPTITNADYDITYSRIWQKSSNATSGYSNLTNNSNSISAESLETNNTFYRCALIVKAKKKNQTNANEISVTVYSPVYKCYWESPLGWGWFKDWYFKLSSDQPSNSNSAIIKDTTSDFVLNTYYIDNSSVLYSSLDKAMKEGIVFSEKSAKEHRNEFLRYINISSPSLKFTQKPKEYNGSGTSVESELKNGGASSLLSYTFEIENPTDPTPTTTHYKCSLYVDLNGDGRYVEEERLSDLTIRDDKGKSVKENELMSGVKYSVSRYLPGSYAGAIPWKLAVNKIDSAGHIINGVLAEEIGYTYIKPTTQAEINILQVKGNGDTLDLKNSNAFTDLYKKISDVYTINVTTVSISDFNSNTDNIRDRLIGNNEFNMLILGFADSYGNLSEPSGEAVQEYIKSGRAVLFTHDTTSFINIPSEKTTSNSGNVEIKYETTKNKTIFWIIPTPYAQTMEGSWGYTFNSVLRDSLGLDRYGVSSDELLFPDNNALKIPIGKTIYRFDQDSRSGEKSGVIANNFEGISESNKKLYISELIKKGYSIAYTPKSGKTSTVDETQGYTKYAITRFWDKSNKYPTKDNNYNVDESINATTRVSKVNEGQITKFPFAIADNIQIAETHEQYYQVNMNSDDIVVWYCLSGGNYAKNGINDVMNDYYIFNKGNVTYSGAGHKPKNMTSDECKLFVNTMVAAYRAGRAESTVEFSDRSLFIPVDDVLEAEGESSYLSTDLKINFSVKNLNAGAGTKNDEKVTFYYTSDDGTDTNFVIDGTPETKKVKPLCSAVYTPNRTYPLEVQGALLEALKNFAASEKTEFSIIVQLESRSADKLEIRKLSLLDIS